MVLYCNNIFDIKDEDYEILFNIMPEERKAKTGRYRKKENRIMSAAAYALLVYAVHLAGSESTAKTGGRFLNAAAEQNPNTGEAFSDHGNFNGGFCYNEKGKPFIPGNPFYFNMSHSANVAACAVEPVEVGVDVQARVDSYERVSRRVCSAGELENLGSCEDPEKYFTMLWTLKEAYVKCIGTGIWDDLSGLDFSAFVEAGDAADESQAVNLCEYRECKFTVHCEDGFCVSACSADRYVDMKQVSIDEVVEYIKYGNPMRGIE